MNRMTNISLDEVKATQKANPTDDLYSNLFSRKVSPFFSVIALRLGVHPNVITAIGIFCGVFCGVMLPMFGVAWVNVFLVISSQLWHVFDVVDGEVARISGKSSINGQFLDLLGHYTVDGFIGIGLAGYFILNSTIHVDSRLSFAFLLFPLMLMSTRLLYHCEEVVRCRRDVKRSDINLYQSGHRSHVLSRWFRQIWTCLGLMLVIGIAAGFDLILQLVFGVELPLLHWVGIFYILTMPIIVAARFRLIWRRLNRTSV